MDPRTFLMAGDAWSLPRRIMLMILDALTVSP